MPPNLTLNLKKMRLVDIPDGSVICFLGKRKSGKSFCIQDLLYKKRDIPMVCAVSGSEEANPFFGNFIPSTFIEPEFNAERIATVIKRQKYISGLKHSDPRHKDIDPRMLVLFDDCLHD